MTTAEPYPTSSEQKAGTSDDEYWNPLVPELIVTDLEASLSFYRAAGFSVRFRRPEPSFAYLELGRAQIMLEQQHADGWNVAPLVRPLGRGINIQVEVVDVQGIFAALVALGFVPLIEPRESWYRVSDTREEGQREFLIQDPDGYLMRFAQYLGRRAAA